MGFIFVPIFALMFIWVGIVRVRDTLKRTQTGSYLSGVCIGAASITFGIFIIWYLVHLAMTPPEVPPAIPPSRFPWIYKPKY